MSVFTVPLRGQTSSRSVIATDVQGAIGGATSEHIAQAIAKAEGEAPQLLVIKLDTPGRRVTSTCQIIGAILASRVSVAVEAPQELLQAGQMVGKQPEAMQLRYFGTLLNVAGEKSSTIIFPLREELTALRTPQQPKTSNRRTFIPFFRMALVQPAIAVP